MPPVLPEKADEQMGCCPSLTFRGELQAGVNRQQHIVGTGEGREGREVWSSLQEAGMRRKGSPRGDVEMAAGVRAQCKERGVPG